MVVYLCVGRGGSLGRCAAQAQRTLFWPGSPRAHHWPVSSGAAAQAFSPFNVVAWHGNYAPFKYDLARFCPGEPSHLLPHLCG